LGDPAVVFWVKCCVTNFFQLRPQCSSHLMQLALLVPYDM